MEALKIILLVIGSYLFGNINIALIISKLKKRDVRKLDSGNPGAMNMFRNFGPVIGVLTLALDALKGIIPCMIGWWILGEPFKLGADKVGVYICGLSLIVGHIFPVFLKFKGGKGIASSIGICMVINPVVTAISFVVGVVFILLTYMGAATSFLIITIPLIFEAFRLTSSGGSIVSVILIFAIFLLTFFKHRGNIIRLFKGTENKTIIFKKKGQSKKNKSGGGM